MYNEKRKQQFLDEKSQTAKISQNLSDTFFTAAQYEEKLGRDLSNWTAREILAFYKKLSTPYVQTLIILHNSLTQYTNWCLENGLVSDNINHFAEIPTEMICRCADVNALRDRTFSRDELLAELKDLPNESDKFIILGLFEGIPISGGTMNRITMSDLSGNELILRSESGVRIATRVITNELRHIMESANSETTYESMASRHRVWSYDWNETTVIKTILSKKNAMRNNYKQLATRLRNCFKWLGYDNITMKSIAESGRLWFISKLCKENKCSFEDAVRKTKYRSTHEDIYGKIQSIPVYLKTYGDVYNSLYEE